MTESTLAVTAVQAFLHTGSPGKNWVFVRVETDGGIAGWGEAYATPDRDRAIAANAEALGGYLVGRSAHDVVSFTRHLAYNDFGLKRGSMELSCATSAIEMALWDIIGKAAARPLYELLGGAVRHSIPVYANGWSKGSGSTEQLAERARAVVDSGLRALKFDPFPGPWRALVGRLALDEAIARVAAVREAVGPDVEIMIEAHRRLAPMVAIAFARRIEAYRPFWFEEPISSRDLVSLAEVRAAVDVPVVTGEELYGMAEFRDVFVHRAADIVNPDVCATGGILELRQIAATAESHHVAVAPHQYNSLTCGLAATLHAAVGMPNLLIVEYFINHEQPSAAIATGGTLPWRIEDGALALPPGPGLGIELEESALTPASGASVAAGPQPRTRSADVAWERPFAGPQDEPRPV